MGWDGTGSVQNPEYLWLGYPGQTGPGGPGPTGRGGQLEGGSVQRNVSEEAVIRVHPSSGMGTRSHSLTRHKAGCVCVRGVGVQGRGFDWEQAMTSLYPSTDH